MDNFEAEDLAVRRLNGLESTPSPPEGSDEASARREALGEGVMELFMMDVLVYAPERDVRANSSSAPSPQQGCRARENSHASLEKHSEPDVTFTGSSYLV